MSTEEDVESLIELAKEKDLKLPRGVKEQRKQAQEALEANDNDQDAALAHLTDTTWPPKKKGGKGKKKAADDDEEKPKKKRAAKAKKEVEEDEGDEDGDEEEEKPKKKAKVAAAKEEDDDAMEDEDEEKPKKKRAPKAKKEEDEEPIVHEPLPEWPATDDKDERKELAVKLAGIGLERKIKLPTDETARVVACMQALLTSKNTDTGDFQPDVALAELERRFGNEVAEKKKAASKAMDVVCPGNKPIVEIFRQLAGQYFKNQDGMKGASFQKAGTSIANLEWEITLDNMPTAGKGPKKVERVAKGSIDTIKEFLTTGTVARLEEMRSGVE